jgi:hypothetical protein
MPIIAGAVSSVPAESLALRGDHRWSVRGCCRIRRNVAGGTFGRQRGMEWGAPRLPWSEMECRLSGTAHSGW